MATSPNLGITHLTQGQNQKHVTVNVAIDQMDGAIAGEGTGSGFDFPSDANFTPTASDVQGVFSIVVAGTITATRTYFLPATSHIWIVENATVSGSDDVIFQVTGGGGTSVTLTSGDRKFIWSDGVDVELATGESPYELGGFFPGVPTVTTMIYKIVMARAVTFPDDFAASQGHAETAPSSNTDIDVQVNSSSIGTISFAMSATTATFVTAGGAVSLVAGDTLEFHTPSNMNSLADISIMLTGSR